MTEIKIPKRKVDLEKLGLINQDLFQVDGELAKKYNTVLKEVFDLKCSVSSFRIDKRGLSPELSKHFKEKYPERFEFGENYLNIRSANRYMIVVSPDQRNAPLVAPQTSYEDEFFDLVHSQARHTIEDVTKSQALFGELENGILLFKTADDLLHLRTIEITLDTLDHAVKSVFELRRMSDNLGQGNNALDPEYIGKMQELVKTVGDVRHRNISDMFPIKREVHCFYVEFFKGVHCLRNLSGYDKVQTIFISHHQDIKKDFGEEIIAIDMHDNGLIETLHKYGFLRYNEDLIDRRIQEIEDEVLLQNKQNVVDMSEHEKKRLTIEHVSEFPEAWNELREIAKIMRNSESAKIEDLIKDKSYETKLKLSEAANKKEIITHLLAELDPTDPIRVYEANRKKLITEFPNLPLQRKRYIAYRLLEYKNQGGN